MKVTKLRIQKLKVGVGGASLGKPGLGGPLGRKKKKLEKRVGRQSHAVSKRASLVSPKQTTTKRGGRGVGGWVSR